MSLATRMHAMFLPRQTRYLPLPLAWWALLLILFSRSGAAAGTANADLQRIKKAYDAVAAGQVKQGFKLAEGLESHPLYPYLTYEYLRPRVHTVAAAEIHRFLDEQQGTMLADRLRTNWLTWLGQAKRWRQLVDDWQPQEDIQLRCRYLSARAQLGETEGLAEAALELWLVGTSQPPDCDPAFAVLYHSPALTDDVVWRRITLAMEAGETGLAGYLARRLTTAADRALVERWLRIQQQPRQTELLARDPDQPRLRAVLAHGIRLLAKQKFDEALRVWSEQRGRFAFSTEEQIAVDRELAVIAARADDPRALDLFAVVPAAQLDAKADELRLRAAVLRQDWAWIVTHTDPIDGASDNVLAWSYWRARALEQAGAGDAARAVYTELARERDYYGFLAADRLGVPYSLNQVPTPMTAEERAGVESLAGVQRAREWLQLGNDYFARREWHFEAARAEPRRQAMLALVAHDWGWHDRAIITMGYTRRYDDLDVRFPTVYRELVEEHAGKRGIDPALIFSIIRAESAFMDDARSSAGALGLMQLLPATGRETASSIGFKLRDQQQLYDAQVNIMLGSAYLKQMLDRFDGSFPMAAAAYNAGPHRVQRWRPASSCAAPDLWVEAVPFRETRRYVKQTLFYAAVYEARLQRRVTPLADRLSTIQPRLITAGTC
ncbi:MAG: transglycosylase SLT domain-containing protein [Gammaproteobacteria bacterium]|nr:transglycosylase SLT domain-containing protein [Gammaproteobacteria bacterium]